MLGAGASARSVALAVGRRWPECAVVIAARSRRAAEDLARGCGGQLLEDLDGRAPSRGAWNVVVNTTTWGETDSSEAEPFGIDLEGVFQPGGRLFDLNNRISGLQHQALTAGCAVVSGGVMQRVTNASRAALLLCRPARWSVRGLVCTAKGHLVDVLSWGRPQTSSSAPDRRGKRDQRSSVANAVRSELYRYGLQTAAPTAMQLSQPEIEKLMLSLAAMVASDRLARGVKLNYPEAVAILTSFVLEGAREGKSVGDLMATGRQVLLANS